jgi:hypothetical protein
MYRGRIEAALLPDNFFRSNSFEGLRWKRRKPFFVWLASGGKTQLNGGSQPCHGCAIRRGCKDQRVQNMKLHALNFHAILLLWGTACLLPHIFPATTRFEYHSSLRRIF